MSIETPIVRIAVLVAVLIASAAAMVAVLALNHSHSSSPATIPLASVNHSAAKPRPVAVTPTKVVQPKPAAPRLLPGLPGPIAYALARHPVAIIGLYEHGANDSAALTEARAGAALAHTTFIALDVLRPRYAGAIAGFTGSLAVPAVIVVRRPGVIVKQLTGYEDRQVVAQAAHDGH